MILKALYLVCSAYMYIFVDYNIMWCLLCCFYFYFDYFLSLFIYFAGPQFSAVSMLALGDAGHIFKLADSDRDLKVYPD